MKTAVVIPTYNEAARLGIVLRAWQGQNLTLIVVDDGSEDNTLAMAKTFSIHYLRHPINLGQGAALKTGTEFAEHLGCSAVVHFDADGQHRVEDALQLLKVLVEGEYEVVLGSRFLTSNQTMPWTKKMILRLARIFNQKILQLRFSDPQCGLRAFRLAVWPKLHWQKDDFLHCNEILNLIIKNKLKYTERPIKVVYAAANQSKRVRPSVNMGWRLLWNKIVE